MRRNTRRARVLYQGMAYSLLLAVAILGLGGVGFWLIDPRIETLTDGLWLAFTTAATVGYGDHVPSTLGSKLFSVGVVLLGLAVLSMVTASLSALLLQREVQAEERQIERDLLREIHRLQQQVQALHQEVQALRPGQTPDQGPQ